MSHTSGSSYDITDPLIKKWSSPIGRSTNTLSRALEGWDTSFRFQPGMSWIYGAGFDWAGQALEKVTGQTLGAYLSENVFTPLAMEDTTFRRQDPAHQERKVHDRNGPKVETPFVCT
jgi:CubicO group peptidase (beta-lactamase class C family)